MEYVVVRMLRRHISNILLVTTVFTVSDLQGTLIDNLKVAKPTIFFGVPRVWEKIKEGIEAKINVAPAYKRWLLSGTNSVMIHKYRHLASG